MKTKIFKYKKQVREYHVFGNGTKILYAFHGFGQNGFSWNVFNEWLGGEFSVYAFNDFYHSETDFSEIDTNANTLEKGDIADFFRQFAFENGHRSINLIAYSSGARTALTLIEYSTVKINEVWLFAPDGIKRSFWNTLFCKYSLVQALFRRIIDDPKLFFRSIEFFKQTRILDKRRLSFVLFSMRTRSKRVKVYNYWLKYRRIIPSLDKVIQNGNENDVRIHLILGKNDAIIKTGIGIEFVKDYGRNSDLFIIEASHYLLEEKHVAALIDRYPIN